MAIQQRLGSQVRQLFIPPIKLDESKSDPGAPAIGVPVAPFPRWMRCPLCDTLATIDSGVFRLKQDQWRPDRTEYRHEGCTKAKGNISPSALSVRFLLACREGHLTDFPWVEFVHKGNMPCKPAQLTLREFGISGDASDIIVQCLVCNSNLRMSDAFYQDALHRGVDAEGRITYDLSFATGHSRAQVPPRFVVRGFELALVRPVAVHQTATVLRQALHVGLGLGVGQHGFVSKLARSLERGR